MYLSKPRFTTRIAMLAIGAALASTAATATANELAACPDTEVSVNVTNAGAPFWSTSLSVLGGQDASDRNARDYVLPNDSSMATARPAAPIRDAKSIVIESIEARAACEAGKVKVSLDLNHPDLLIEQFSKSYTVEPHGEQQQTVIDRGDLVIRFTVAPIH